jgi:hypothetical protein
MEETSSTSGTTPRKKLKKHGKYGKHLKLMQKSQFALFSPLLAQALFINMSTTYSYLETADGVSI